MILHKPTISVVVDGALNKEHVHVIVNFVLGYENGFFRF